MSEKLKTGSKLWIESLKNVLMTYAPPLVECDKCGNVIHRDYVCPCGHDNSGTYTEVEPWGWI